jgi:hypothetical protein
MLPNLADGASATAWPDVVLIAVIAAFVFGVLWLFFRGDR